MEQVEWKKWSGYKKFVKVIWQLGRTNLTRNIFIKNTIEYVLEYKVLNFVKSDFNTWVEFSMLLYR